jgi:hypothetical protein
MTSPSARSTPLSPEEAYAEWTRTGRTPTDYTLSIMSGTNSTTSSIIGHGRTVGRLLYGAGRRLEQELNRVASCAILRERLDALGSRADFSLLRFDETGHVSHLDEAIGFLREEVELRSRSLLVREKPLINLAQAIGRRYSLGGDVVLLVEEVSLRRKVLELCRSGHSTRDTALNSIYIVIRLLLNLVSMAGFLPGFGLLVEQIAILHESLDLRPLGHPGQAALLSCLGNALIAQFEQTGDAALINQAVALHRKSLGLCPPGHPNRAMSLHNLGNALHTHFEQTGDVALLPEAITLFNESLNLRPPGHPTRKMSLTNLGGALYTQLKRMSHVVLIHQGVTMIHDELLELFPRGYSGRGRSLNNLGNTLLARFEQTSDVALLDKVVVLLRESLKLHPPGHPDRESSLSNLGNALLAQFEQTGDAALLPEMDVLLRELLELYPPGHSSRHHSLHGLARLLVIRFKQGSGLALLAEAITLLREAVDTGNLTCLASLADALLLQYEESNDDKHLTESVNLCRRALAHATPGHRERGNRLHGLAKALRVLSTATGTMNALEEAVHLEAEAANLELKVSLCK